MTIYTEIKPHHSRKTTEQFIIDATNIHKNKYDYSLVDYKNSRTKVVIICKIHGKFNQRPNSNLQGADCKQCGSLRVKSTLEKFILKSNIIHNNKYDYSLVDYKLSRIKVSIICKSHGVFNQKPNSHLNGHGCPECKSEDIGNRYRKSKNQFIIDATKVHNSLYDYSLVDYKKNKIKIKIVCLIHGIFEQTPNMHLLGAGCKYCSGMFQKNTEIFIKNSMLIHGNRYDYSLVDYKQNKIKIKIICFIHGAFEQKPNAHLNNQGCPKCAKNISKMGTDWINSLNNKNIIHEHPLPENIKRKVDGYDIITNTVYQFHGRYWHSDPRLYKPNDMNIKLGITHGENYKKTLEKDQQLRDWGYNLVIMWEYDWLKLKKEN